MISPFPAPFGNRKIDGKRSALIFDSQKKLFIHGVDHYFTMLVRINSSVGIECIILDKENHSTQSVLSQEPDTRLLWVFSREKTHNKCCNGALRLTEQTGRRRDAMGSYWAMFKKLG